MTASAGTLGIWIGRLALIAGIAVLAAAPWLFRVTDLAMLTEFLSLLTIAIMWNLLAGYADIVSVGQHAFVGIGAYAFFGFAVIVQMDPYLAIPMAALVALVFAVPVMGVIFRLRAAYLAVGSWVVAETLMLAAGKLSAFGGGSGVSMPVSVVRAFGTRPADRYSTIYWIAFVVAALAFVSTWLLMRSRTGLGLTAMRDNEEGAGVIGVNLTRVRILCFLWTAPFLGLAGAVITLQKLRVAPSASFSIIDWTVYVIFIVVIGGIGSFEGPIIGTVVFFLIRNYLSEIGVWHFILLGVLSIGVVLVEPGGLWGLLRRFLPDDLIPISRKPPRPASAERADQPANEEV